MINCNKLVNSQMEFYSYCLQTIIIGNSFKKLFTKNSCFVFHQGFQTPWNNKSTRPAALCFHLFLSVWNPWWNTRTRFWYITSGMCFTKVASYFKSDWKHWNNLLKQVKCATNKKIGILDCMWPLHWSEWYCRTLCTYVRVFCLKW